MTTTQAKRTGQILHLQRLSTEDGPGLRTTIFFKGCPLACAWCHNPESISTERQIQWLENRCIGCNTCIKVCPNKSLSRKSECLELDRSTCSICGECVDACPGNALEMLGKEVTVAEIFREVLKDRVYYEKSGGGVTLSGGEPTWQPTFTLELLQAFHEAGIRTALDTCGLCSKITLKQLLPFCDTVLFDLKILDQSNHEQWTGQSNRVILENLAWLAGEIGQMTKPVELWIRTPLIPGATDMVENIASISQYLGQYAGGIAQRWELCAFNNLCRDKYRRLGMDWQFNEAVLLSKEHLDEIEMNASQNGFPPEKIFITGARKVEERS